MDKKPSLTRPKRIWELDFLRGLSIIMVTWDHMMYNMGRLFGDFWRDSDKDFLAKAADFAEGYVTGRLRYLFWPVFVIIFFSISGICTALSKNNLFRGIKLALFAGGVSLVTWLLQEVGQSEGTFIAFGVLHCLASCILLYAIADILVKLCTKNNVIQGFIFAAIAAALFIINRETNFSIYEISAEVDRMYRVYSTFKLQGLFVYRIDFWRITADYFPLLPYSAFFMLGAGLSKVLYADKTSLLPCLDGVWNKPIKFAGRHSLFIYLALEVVGILILALVTLIFTGSMGII